MTILIVNRGYSAHEFSASYAQHHPSEPSSLPLDIRVETVVSTVLVCFGLVGGADRLRPIKWSVWAGNIEREGGGANPYRGLEERAGFLDIRVCGRNAASFVDTMLILCRRNVLSLPTGSERAAPSQTVEDMSCNFRHNLPLPTSDRTCASERSLSSWRQ